MLLAQRMCVLHHAMAQKSLDVKSVPRLYSYSAFITAGRKFSTRGRPRTMVRMWRRKLHRIVKEEEKPDKKDAFIDCTLVDAAPNHTAR